MSGHNAGLPPTWRDVLASIEGLAYPAEPGGPLTATRLAIVRRLAATDHHAPHAQALLDALDEVESLRAERDEHHADAALTARLLAEVPGSAEWPPAWLRDHDAAAYAIACRVLAACEGRRE